MRLFLAVEPSAAAREQLELLTADVRRALGDAADRLRWTPAANVHLTLHFLGEVDDGRLSGLRESLGSELAGSPFDTQVGALGTFPVGRPPHTLWVSLQAGGAMLGRLHGDLASRLREAGARVETRPFSPHMTLARVRDRERHRAARRVAEGLAHVRVPPIGWRVDRVTLFRSDLSGSAPRYDALHEILLRER